MSKRRYTSHSSDKSNKYATADKRDNKKFMLALAVITLALMGLLYLLMH